MTIAVIHTDLSPAAMAFLSEIEQVCRKHGFALAPSSYDSLQVWPLKQGEEPLQFPGIESREDAA